MCSQLANNSHAFVCINVNIVDFYQFTGTSLFAVLIMLIDSINEIKTIQFDVRIKIRKKK